MVIQKTKRRQNCFYQIAILILAASAVVLIGIGCGGDQHQLTPTTDSTPPAESVTLSAAKVQGASLALTATNPNNEEVQIEITFKPALPGSATLIVDGDALTPEDGSYIITIPASRMIEIRSGAIPAGVAYIITATTSDTSGNSRSETPRWSLRSVDATPPAKSATLSSAPKEGISLRFRVTNPNSDEEVRARLTFSPPLPDDATLIPVGKSAPIPRRDGSYALSVPRGGTVVLESNDVPDDVSYTIMVTTSDTSGNSRIGTAPLSLTPADITAPEDSVMLSEVSVDAVATPFAFRVTNPNDETVDVELTFNPALSNGAIVTRVGGSALTKAADGSFPLSLTADGTAGDSAEIRLMSSAITDGSEHTITATTADTIGNDRSGSTSLTVTADSYGDSIATAQAVTGIHATIRGVLSSGDSDYFAVTLYTPNGNLFRVYSEGTTDTVGRILFSNAELGRDDNSGTKNNFDVTTDVTSSGTYYIEVKGKTASVSGSYSLELFFHKVPGFSRDPAWTDTTKTSATFSATADTAGTLYWGAYAYTKMPDGTLVAPAKPVGAALTTFRNHASANELTFGSMDVTAGAQVSFTISALTVNKKYDLYAFLESNDGANLISELEKLTFATTFYRHANGVTILCPGASVGDSGVIRDLNGRGSKTYTKRTRAQIAADEDRSEAPTTCTSDITSMQTLFNVKQKFNGDISHWDTSSVTDMYRMFRNLPTIPAPQFNVDISKWDTSKVWNMQGMFYGASAFNRDISGWDVSNVTIMKNMFRGATRFNQNIGGWDVSKVTDMSNMFRLATHFNNGGNSSIGTWPVSSVIDVRGMFHFAQSFRQNLSRWCVKSVTNRVDFDNSARFLTALPNWSNTSCTDPAR